MAIGRAKLPQDLNFGLRKTTRSVFQHKTIEHHRTNTSFVNASFNDYAAAGQMTPIDVDVTSRKRKQSGRVSLSKKNKTAHRVQSPASKQVSPRQV